MKNIFALLALTISFSSFCQLDVKTPEHRETLYDHYDSSLKLMRISNDSTLHYVFHYHDKRNPETEKSNEMILKSYTEVRQFLDLCDSTMNSKAEFKTDFYTIKAFDKSGAVQAWVYMPDGSFFHVTREVYFELDKALEKKEHTYFKH